VIEVRDCFAAGAQLVPTADSSPREDESSLHHFGGVRLGGCLSWVVGWSGGRQKKSMNA